MNLEQLQSFNLPAGAVEAIAKNGYKIVDMNDGVSRMSGHDKGVSYKFLNIPVRNEQKSKEAGFDIPDQIEHIQWFVSRRTQPIERVSELPEALLKFNNLGECVGGRYQQEYLRFKEGLSCEGLQLSRWPEASDSDVFSLASQGVFTVEQLASMKRDRVHDLFGGYFDELYEKALAYANKGEDSSKTAEMAETIVELKKQLAKMEARISEQEAVSEKEEDITEVVAKAEKAVKKKGK